MRIPTFRVKEQRNIRLAECQTVPRVMIITGPNGCGKSTLLQSLRSVLAGARPMYIGPHRVSRPPNLGSSTEGEVCVLISREGITP